MAVPERYHPIEALAPKAKLELVRATPATRPSVRAWLWFALQLLAIAALELGDDIFRGNLDPPNVRQAIQHAQQIAHFEQVHGFFLEPALQLWVRHAHALFGLLSYDSVEQLTNLIYALGQTLVPILVAAWIYLQHRSHWPLVRTITLLSTLLALVGYELYPTAPPRLTTGLVYQHHLFHFQDAMQHVIGDGKLGGSPIGYNAYSAMPSLHMAWALIVAVCLILLAQHLLLRLLAGLYPLVMFATVVVSANHYLLDAAGAALVVAVAAVLALALEPGHGHLRGLRSAIRNRSAAATPVALPSITITQKATVKERRHHGYFKACPLR